MLNVEHFKTEEEYKEKNKSTHSLPFERQQHIEKQRHYFANKGPSSQGYGLSCGHVWM